jgi:pimeloyl-ACP methyl ester carboxylesterase
MRGGSISQANRYLSGFCSSQGIFPPQIIQVLLRAPVNAWVCIGLGGEADFRPITLPVLDLYGENDLPYVLQGAQRRAASIKDVQRSQQVMAPQADHFFTNQQAELVRYVRDFLDKVL